MLRYRVKLSKDTNDTILVEVPDVPGAVTFGEDRAEALLRAPDAIESALMGYIDLRRNIPVPRAGGRGPFATLPALTEAKLALYTAMRTARVSKSELARRMNIHMPQVDRLIDLRHASRLDQLEAAFHALGKRISVQVSEAA
jgi:antitoxin HicB